MTLACWTLHVRRHMHLTDRCGWSVTGETLFNLQDPLWLEINTIRM